ncbi:MAG: enoyl-CoA hydratase/isomerase family protein [Devosia sp.]|nr:enoyl-CoA hydratase/isomerase family protein [Devosia sp.]
MKNLATTTPDTPLLANTADGILTLTLNRPDHANSVTVDVGKSRIAHFQTAASNPAIRAMVLTATGGIFCAGFDLKTQPQVDTLQLARERSKVWEALLFATVDFPKPLVMALNGPAVGLGCMFALLADRLVSVRDVILSLPEIRHGWPTPVGYTIAKFGLNHAIATDMVLSARRVRLADVAHLRPPTEFTDRDQLLPAAQRAAASLSASHAITYARNKQWLSHHLRQELKDAYVANTRFRDENFAAAQ